MRKLFDHQRKALAYARGRQRIALFMEMRLGKCLVTIRWAQHHGIRRVLVLAPVTVLNSWMDELELENETAVWWLNGLDRKLKLRVARIPRGPRTWYLLNYEGLRTVPELLDLPWDAIICDESTAIRNPGAKITKLLSSARVKAPYRALLSGLPNPESPLDYFQQFQFLHGSFLDFSNFYVFRHVKFRTLYTDWDWHPKPGVQEDIKRFVHTNAFVLTCQQAGVGNKRLYEKRVIPVPVALARTIKKIDKEFEYEGSVTNYAITKVLWMARLAGGFDPMTGELISRHKIDELLRLATGELKKEKLVVWFRFNAELEAVVRELNENGVKARGITGKTPPRERGKIARRFAGQAFRVLCIQGKVGQFSMNLSPASVAIYYSNHYDNEIRNQTEARIEHLAKNRPLLYLDLVSAGTIDEDALQALKEKKLTARQMSNQLAATWGASYRERHGLSRVFPSAGK